jgi:hypothetical protein
MSQEEGPDMSYEREIGEVKATLDGLAHEFVDFRAEQRRWQATWDARFDRVVRDHADRLSRLERHRAWLAGGLAVLGMIAAVVVAWVRSLLFNGPR